MFGFLKRLFGERPVIKKETREEQENKGLQNEAESEYTGSLELCVVGNGTRVNYEPGGLYGTKCLWWVSEETDEKGDPVYIRESKERTTKYPAALPFKVAGKLYLSLSQLYGGEVTDGVTTDVHGRQILCYRERFPCFDSFDYLHELRYYRWFLLKENGNLTRVYTADESGWIHVTEDVENLENKMVDELKKYHWI